MSTDFREHRGGICVGSGMCAIPWQWGRYLGLCCVLTFWCLFSGEVRGRKVKKTWTVFFLGCEGYLSMPGISWMCVCVQIFVNGWCVFALCLFVWCVFVFPLWSLTHPLIRYVKAHTHKPAHPQTNTHNNGWEMKARALTNNKRGWGNDFSFVASHFHVSLPCRPAQGPCYSATVHYILLCPVPTLKKMERRKQEIERPRAYFVWKWQCKYALYIIQVIVYKAYGKLVCHLHLYFLLG